MDAHPLPNQLNPKHPGTRSLFTSKKRFKISKKLISAVVPSLVNDSNVERSSLPKIVKGVHKSRYFNYKTNTESELEEPKQEIENLKKKLLEKEFEIIALKNLYLDVHQDLKREKSLNHLDRIISPKKEYELGVIGKMVSYELPSRNLSTPIRADIFAKHSPHSQFLQQKHSKAKLKIVN